MSVNILHNRERKILEINVTGKLTKADYEQFVPEIERLIEAHGKLRVLLAMHDFHGWTAGALWEDIKFDARHFSDVQRLAILGETRWQKGMAAFCKPFTTAKVRYFDYNQPGAAEQARSWLATGEESATGTPAAGGTSRQQ